MQLRNIQLSSKFRIGERGHRYVFTARAKVRDEEAQDYCSQIYQDPDMADLIHTADESVDVTHDHHHIFLEGFEIVEGHPEGHPEVGKIEIRFGS